MHHGWLTLRWEKEKQYYAIYLQQTLWGEWCLLKEWGQSGQKSHTEEVVLEGQEDGIRHIQRIKQLREKEGFALS